MRLPVVIVSFVAAACSRPIATTPRHPASLSPSVARPAVPASVAPAPTSTHDRLDPVAEPADDLLDSRLEHDRVNGIGIEIEVSWWTLTGTTHVAQALSLTTARGTLRLESQDEEDAPTLPLVEQIYSAGPNRWVAFGWSSLGEGMQTEHAWLIDGKGTPRIVDTLAWTTDRKHAGLAIDATKTVRVGIPLPRRTKDDDDEGSLHNEGSWSLVHDKRSFTLDQVGRLPSVAENLMTLQHYTPPAHDSPTGRDWTGRFVWFSAGRQFALERR